MKQIKESTNRMNWPRWKCEQVECRKRDLVLRITDWMDDKDEPGYDVEVYIGGVYDWNESKSHTIFEHKTKEKAKEAALAFARTQIAKLL